MRSRLSALVPAVARAIANAVAVALAVVAATAASSACAADAGDGSEISAAESELRARTVRLTDGSTVHGIPVAAYAHDAWWWDAAPETTYALFDPAAFSATPGLDRSLRFVDRSQLAPGQAPLVARSRTPAAYRAWARASGVRLQRLPLDGVARVLNGNERWHRDEGGFGDFAWDLVTTFADGATSHAPGLALTDYAVWDAAVYLPTGGWVVDVDDSAPDNVPGTIPPGPMKSIKNNMIGVQVAGSYYVYLLHFRQGSIPRASRGTCAPAVPDQPCIEPGTYLQAGTYLGRAGNSGVTYEPHLHVTAYFWDTARAPERSWSVPVDFARLHIRGADEATARLATDAVPRTGDALSNEAF